MMNYLIISPQADEVNLLQAHFAKITNIQVATLLLNDELTASTIESSNPDVIICNNELLKQEHLLEIKSSFPNMVIVATCNIAQIATQQPPEEIFGYLPIPVTFERTLALTENIYTMLLQQAQPLNEKKKDYVFIKSEYKLIKTNFCDILFIAGMKDYTQVYLRGKQSPLTTLQNLKEFETKLPNDEFIRVHRSYIVSLSQVDVIARNEIMLGQHHIPIGDSYRQTLDMIIEKNS